MCPYCSKQTNRMTAIEDHVTGDHPSEVFKFEVVQDAITYLQDMVQCPLCQGGFTWKLDFLHHLGSVHRLEDLVTHLETSAPDRPTISSLKVPRRLFKDLLPAPPASSTLESADFSGDEECEEDNMADNMVKEDILQTKESPGGTGGGRDSGQVLRYHCEVCEFSGNDFPSYRSHMLLHGEKLDGGSAHDSFDREDTKSPSPTLLRDAHGSQSALLDGPQRREKLRLFCHLCPFECNKTLNYRRHLAIHERNETMTDGFRCGYCQFIHDRLNCIKFHLGKYHGTLPRKMYRIVGGSETEVDPDDELLRFKNGSLSQTSQGRSGSVSSTGLEGRVKRVLKKTNRWAANWESTFSAAGEWEQMSVCDRVRSGDFRTGKENKNSEWKW